MRLGGAKNMRPLSGGGAKTEIQNSKPTKFVVIIDPKTISYDIFNINRLGRSKSLTFLLTPILNWAENAENLIRGRLSTRTNIVVFNDLLNSISSHKLNNYIPSSVQELTRRTERGAQTEKIPLEQLLLGEKAPDIEAEENSRKSTVHSTKNPHVRSSHGILFCATQAT